MQVVHTAGLPPSVGRTILPNIGSITNNKAALRKTARVKISPIHRPGTPAGGAGSDPCIRISATFASMWSLLGQRRDRGDASRSFRFFSTKYSIGRYTARRIAGQLA